MGWLPVKIGRCCWAVAVLAGWGLAAAAPLAAQLSEVSAAAKGQAAAPVFSPASGTHTAPLSITLSSTTPGASIYYTLDGSGPSRASSPLYHHPITLTASATVKAFAWKSGLKGSAVSKATYTVVAPPAPPVPPAPPAPGEGTLFLSTLTPQTGAASAGSGSATLQLAADGKTAWLKFQYSGLSGVLTSSHIHGAGGVILFDLDTAPPGVDGVRVWQIRRAGTLDEAAVLAALRGGECYLNLHTALYPAGEISGYFRQASGSVVFVPPPSPPALPGGAPTAPDAARFLLQATYGPRPEEIASLQSQGFSAWLQQQFALPAMSHLDAYDQLVAAGEEERPELVRESFFRQAIQGPDQLRQRVAFALSEIFVVSDRDADVRRAPEGLASYFDTLSSGAFGNYRELLERVTLHAAMGVYLDLAGSSRADVVSGRLPNENYPREVLQLFSIGLYQLHPDGTLRLDADGQPIATYDQPVVEGLARALTGWTFGGQRRDNPLRFFRPRRDFRIPMEPWPQYHESGAKTLLDGAVLPAGQSAQQDMEQALDTIFEHPNTGPFVCRLLIQRLVTSNPSRGYVYRCGLAFADNGAGVRGDLRAVVRAILLDYDARAAQPAARPDYGHLREPAVRFTGLLRVLRAEPRGGRFRFAGLDRAGLGLGQTPLRAPTVFNFFEPGYALPGEIAQAGLVSPEFQITTETTSLGAANLHQAVLAAAAGGGGPIAVDLSPFLPPQVVTDAALVERLNLLFFAGAMSAETRGILQDALADPALTANPRQRVLRMLWLVSLAPEASVQK